jgi:hypothetical protein
LSTQSLSPLTPLQLDNTLSRKMQLPLAVRFDDKEINAPVRGFIRIAIEKHLLLWTSWRYRPRDEDRAWDWWRIFLECRSSGGRYECYAALESGNLQGLMALDISGKRTRTGRAIIVDYLATKPANRTAGLGLKYVGVALIAVAIIRSIEIGCGGRIRLESLPGAASFYEHLGMAKQPRLSVEGNLVYTLEAPAAEQLLDEIKRQGILEL